MTDLLTLTVPLFLLIGGGFTAVRSGLFAASDVQTLDRFVLFVALPALIVRASAQRPLAITAVLTASVLTIDGWPWLLRP